MVRALDCFHSPEKVYTVLDFAGDKNLASHLLDLPGLRMPEEEAIQCLLGLYRESKGKIGGKWQTINLGVCKSVVTLN